MIYLAFDLSLFFELNDRVLLQIHIFSVPLKIPIPYFSIAWLFFRNSYGSLYF